MWTPKRILILIGGCFLFLTLFGVHSYFLGSIDGLPELPEAYRPTSNETGSSGLVEISDPEKRIIEAWGPECEELKRDIKLFLRSKGLAIAAGRFDIEKDGRVLLHPCSFCVFPKVRSDGKFP